MRSIRPPIAALAMFLVLTAAVQPEVTPATQAPRVASEKFVLPNGLQVIFHVDRKLPIVHVNQWFHVGSKNEKPGRTGFAHLFEHMMFQGSKNAAGEYFAHAERVGANLRAGGVNGTTDFDRTNYFITAPSASLEFLLWLESDRLSSLLDVLDKAKLDNQRDVVKNERRQGLENVPYGRAYDTILQNMFPSGHPYSWPVIGSQEDLTAATLDDVKEFFRQYYTPNNLTLTIVGDFDPSEARKSIEKFFGPIQPGPGLVRPARLPAELRADKLVVVADRVPQPRTYLAWHGAPFFHADEAPLDLAAAVLTDGLSSRLQKLLVYEKQLCSAVDSGHMSLEAAGGFMIDATARPGQPLEAVEKLIVEQLHELAEKGPTPAELERARNKHEYQFVTGLERIGGFGGKADQLGRYNTYLGRHDMFEADLARYTAVTPEAVRDAVARYLDGKPHVTVRFVPEQSARPAAAEIDRAKIPALGADRAFQPPKVGTAKLSNGLTVFAIENHELAKVAIHLVVKAGNAVEPLDRAGLAALAMKALDKGTPAHGALEIEESLAALGTELSRWASHEYSAVMMQLMSKHLPRAFPIFADVVMHPAYPAEEVERERRKMLDDLLQSQRDANRIARRLVPMLAFGREHPYGHAPGEEATIQAIAPEDLKRFHADWFAPGNAALVFTGDITLDRARALAEEQFGAWPKGERARPPVPPAAPADPSKIYLIDRQDAAQTVLMCTLPGIARSSPDYYALQLVDTVLGGSFGSRLNLNLREKKGYSYGVFSYPACLLRGGWWQAGGGVQTKVTKESILEFATELAGMAGGRPITAAELEQAKANRIRGYSQGFESLGGVAAKVAELWAMERPLTELADEPVELEKVSLAAANAMALKYCVPSKAHWLLVGDRSKIEAGVRELKRGEIVVLDAMGRPAKP